MIRPKGMNRKEWSEVEKSVNQLTEVEKANLLLIWGNSAEMYESRKVEKRLRYAKYLADKGIINEGLNGEIKDFSEERFAETIFILLFSENETE
ncbi:MAG TPA: hypothetical protein VF941_15490 [Clostridia bacterium]